MARALLQLQALALDPNNASTGTALAHLHGGVGGGRGEEAGSNETPRSQGEANRSQYFQQQKYEDVPRQQAPPAGDRRHQLAARKSLDDGRGRSLLNTWIGIADAPSSSSSAAFAGESSVTSARQRPQPPGGPQRSATARVRSSSATSRQSRPVLSPRQQAKRMELTQEIGRQPVSGIYIHIYIDIYIFTNTHTHVVCVCVYVHTCIYVYTCIYIYVYNTQTHTHTHTHIR